MTSSKHRRPRAHGARNALIGFVLGVGLAIPATSLASSSQSPSADVAQAIALLQDAQAQMASPSATPTPSSTPTPTPSATPTPSSTPTPTPTPSSTATPGARLFGSTSLWNTVKAPTVFAPAADSTLRSDTYGVNDGAFDHPTYFAKASDPVTTFHLGAGWGHPATTITAPAPAGMKTSTGSDHVMTVLLANGTLLDMDSVSGSGTNFTATYYGTSDGVNGPGFGDPNTWSAIGTTGIGCPQAAGTILARDVAAGVINHAVDIAFDYSQLGGNVLPAVSNDDGGATGSIPEGGLLFIPAGTPRPEGLSPMGVALWNAASTFGVYVTDQLGGNPQFYGDGTVSGAFNGTDFTTVGRALRLVK